ncbi:DUF2971 domain-containing protein [Flagellimonas marina]|jgi:hypothetical protein|uniref:DUF2971 domain-containing protein n=1 Tax=Flagellimonas marina TaxID=1775168 RepID=A0ABV8PHJ1_9FLAO
MGFDQKGEVKIKLPIFKHGEFLWKYLDLHKLLNFVIKNELVFTRLDLLEDPIEGLSTSHLRAANLEDLINESENKEKVSQIKEKFPNLLKGKEFRPVFGKHKQQLQFANCWFHGERESMAMWNLYSNKDSVAIKVVAEDFISYLTKAAAKFVEQNGYKVHFIADSVKYLHLNPFDPDLSKQNFRYSAFKKDSSYKHEQEYRLLLYVHSKWQEDHKFKFIKFPLGDNDLQIEIVCHPLMQEWKRTNLENLVSKFNNDIHVKKSDIFMAV